MSDFSASEGDSADEIVKVAGEGGLDADQDVVIEEHEESGDATSATSTGKMNPQAPGWTKRVRVGKHPPDRMPCPDRVGVLEQTIRGYADKLGEHVVKPVIGLTFDYLGEAYDLYNLYSWEHGFGKLIRENSRSCRYECPAMIRLLRTHNNGWYITEHRANHNHSLNTTCGEKVNWPSHKHIGVYTKDLVKQLRQNNVNVTKVYKGAVVVKCNMSIEGHASKIYTRAMFGQFGELLYRANAYKIEEVEKLKLYKAVHTQAERQEKWVRVVYDGKVMDDCDKFECEWPVRAYGDAMQPHAESHGRLGVYGDPTRVDREAVGKRRGRYTTSTPANIPKRSCW